MTMNAPLALTYAKTTWMGVTPRRAAALTGASTGPFGYVLISLSEGRVCERGGGDEGQRGNGKKRENVWKTTVRFNNYIKEVCFACNCRGVTKCMCAFY